MQNKFDLTTSSGIEKAMGAIARSVAASAAADIGVGAVLGGVSEAFIATCPDEPLTIPIFDPVFDGLKQLFKSVFPTTKEQADCAEKLIKAGKENGVDEMEIILDKDIGGKVKVPEKFGKTEAFLGSEGKVHIKVKYKR